MCSLSFTATKRAQLCLLRLQLLLFFCPIPYCLFRCFYTYFLILIHMAFSNSFVLYQKRERYWCVCICRQYLLRLHSKVLILKICCFYKGIWSSFLMVFYTLHIRVSLNARGRSISISFIFDVIVSQSFSACVCVFASYIYTHLSCVRSHFILSAWFFSLSFFLLFFSSSLLFLLQNTF